MHVPSPSRSLRALQIAPVALLVLVGLAAGVARAETGGPPAVYPVTITCEDATVQRCTPAFTVRVTTQGDLAVEFVPATTHCSSMIAHLSLDGVERFTSKPLAPGVSSGRQVFGPVEPGPHEVAVQAEGVVDGCNTGGLGSWGGTLTVEASAVSVTPTPTPQPSQAATAAPIASPAAGTDSTPVVLGIAALATLAGGAIAARSYLRLRRSRLLADADQVAYPGDPHIPPNPVYPGDPHIPPNPVYPGDPHIPPNPVSEDQQTRR